MPAESSLCARDDRCPRRARVHAKEPANPDRMLPAPRADEIVVMLRCVLVASRSSGPSQRSRQATSATVRGPGRTLPMSPHDTEGIPTFGRPVATGAEESDAPEPRPPLRTRRSNQQTDQRCGDARGRSSRRRASWRGLRALSRATNPWQECRSRRTHRAGGRSPRLPTRTRTGREAGGS